MGGTQLKRSKTYSTLTLLVMYEEKPEKIIKTLPRYNNTYNFKEEKVVARHKATYCVKCMGTMTTSNCKHKKIPSVVKL